MMITKQESATDQGLIDLALRNPASFSYLIERYQQKLFRYIQRTLFVNKEDTEDILQEVFIKVYRNLNSYNPRYKFSSWIYRITYNQCVTYLRQNNARKQNTNSDAAYRVINELASEIDLEAEVLTATNRETVTAALHNLDAKYRTALVLKYMEEKDYNEISEIMQIPTGTVGSLISRAKILFKDVIEYGRIN